MVSAASADSSESESFPTIEVGWLVTLEPAWSPMADEQAGRVLIGSRREESGKHYTSPDGLFSAVRIGVAHRMQTIYLAGLGDVYSIEVEELPRWTGGPSVTVELSDKEPATLVIGASECRRCWVDDTDLGDVQIEREMQGWRTAVFSAQLPPSKALGEKYVYVQVTCTGADVPDEVRLRWADIRAYVEGRQAMLREMG